MLGVRAHSPTPTNKVFPSISKYFKVFPHLLDAEVGVAGRDGAPEVVAQRVQHGVVRVHGRQPVLLQLLGHDAHQLLHARLVVGPVAHDLQAVRQVAVGVGEVGLQLERRAVRLDGLGDVARVLEKG